MQIGTLKRKLGEWGGYWIPSLIIGFLSTFLSERKRNLPANPSILIMLIEHLGDIVVTTPLLRGLRTAFPGAKITVVVSRIGHSFIEHCPYVDNVIVAESSNTWLGQLRRSFRIARSLRLLDIDLAIVPKDAANTDFNELVCALASSKWRVSRVRPERIYRIKPLKFFPLYDEIFIDQEVKHEVETRLGFAQRLTTQVLTSNLESWLTNDDYAFADNFISSTLGSDQNLVAFGIGASADDRKWPAESYAKLIDRLGQDRGTAALLIIGPSDIDLARKITGLAKQPVYFSTGATVRQSIALLKRCSIFIGNDSGPLHLAASANIPVVEISAHPAGASDRSIHSPVRFGPYSVNREILQPQPMDPRCAQNGCMSTLVPHCILQITPEEVANAAARVLRSNLPKDVGLSA